MHFRPALVCALALLAACTITATATADGVTRLVNQTPTAPQTDAYSSTDGQRLVLGHVLSSVGEVELYNGAVLHVYARDGDAWQVEDIILAEDALNDDRFTARAAIDGDRLVVRMFFRAPTGDTASSVVLFSRTDEGWFEQSRIYGEEFEPGALRFGHALAFSGSMLLIGSPARTAVSPNGAVYVFEEKNDSWTLN